MKKFRIALTLAALLTLVLTSTVSAQYSGYAWSTAYQVVNMGTAAANISIDYYDSTGAVVTAAHKTYTGVPAGGSRLVVQFTDDPSLPSGRYSAVISADQPIAAIANQQLVPSGASSYSPVPPFSTYSGQDAGAASITLPAVMYNWYNYYTDVYVMNVGTAAASNVDITYIPGSISGTATGASGVTDLNHAIAQYASLEVSQESLTTLGAPSGTYAGRFLGSAVITADQPIIAVVNQNNVTAHKLMTYNGFASGATDIAIPVHMRGYFNYYSTMLVANPSASATAHVNITYTPTGAYNVVSSGTVGPVTVPYDIAPQTALTRYDGPGATDAQSDLDDSPVFTRFYGSARITSDIPVVVLENTEAVATGDDQAGSYNGIPIADATQDIVSPVIASSFYGYYTTLVVQNATATAGSCSVTYTSDGTYSAVLNHSAVYTHALPANGAFTVYEGTKGGKSGDINLDPANWGASTRFLGAAAIHCTVNAMAIVNEESDVSLRDSMYTFNTFNK
jgi:hypothetical protein